MPPCPQSMNTLSDGLLKQIEQIASPPSAGFGLIDSWLT